MILLNDLPEALDDWRAGELILRDLLALLVDLLEYHEVDEVLAVLSEPVRTDFTSALRDCFDNDTPAEEILWIDSARGEHPAKVAIVGRARSWLPGAPADLRRKGQSEEDQRLARRKRQKPL